jgi:hypothetical protein
MSNQEIEVRIHELSKKIESLENTLATDPTVDSKIYHESIKAHQDMIDFLESQIKVTGRPSIGVTKKVSITLPEEMWDKLEFAKLTSGSSSMSELLRKIINAAID